MASCKSNALCTLVAIAIVAPLQAASPTTSLGGEHSIFEQYLNAIKAAQRSIYIEIQAIGVEAIVAGLVEALNRGVEVVVLVPTGPEDYVRADRRKPEHEAFFDLLASLGRYDQFALVGIAAPGADGGRNDAYVHAKIMLIDDAWATVGSCNLHANSLIGHTEMNASFWDPSTVRALRCELFCEHLGQGTADLDDLAAMSLYRQIARDNRRRRDVGDFDWQGLAFSLDPATYAA